MRHEPLKDRCIGKWPHILAAMGVPDKALRNRHGPCPLPGCGGKDRFRFDDRNGTGSFICSQCGAGDGIEFVKKFLGLEFKDAAREIEKHLGDAIVLPKAGIQKPQDDQKRREMIALWKRAKPVRYDDAAGIYLGKRLGTFSLPDNVRFVADERYVESGAKASWHPAMIAKVDPSDDAKAQGQKAALHRTYLDTLGNKAEVSTPRKMMGTMPVGAAVRLMPYTDTLGIAEGIETALSASILHGVPTWAALNAGLLADWSPPANVETVFIFGDNDFSYTGQAAAYALGQKLRAKGLTVIVELPIRTDTDWNDVLVERRKLA